MELDDRTTERLNRIAPPSTRKCSEFIREALVQGAANQAYRLQPQQGEDIDVDPTT